MCNCKDVQMGSYSNSTVLVYPDWFESKHLIRTADIDNCLVEEIKDLWSRGIQTTACCCGHNVAPAIISVVPKHIRKMEKLGYEHFCDLNLEEAGTHFKPKSIKILKERQIMVKENTTTKIERKFTGACSMDSDEHDSIMEEIESEANNG